MTTVKKIGYISLLLTLVSVVLSKSGVHLFFLVTLASAITYLFLNKKNFFHKEINNYKVIILLLLTYPLAAFSSLMSNCGIVCAEQSLIHNTSMLLFIPLLAFLDKPKNIHRILWSLLGAATLGAFYSFYLFGTKHHWAYNSQVRVASFFDVSRWGLLLMMVCLLIVILFLEKPKKDFRKSWIFIFINLLVALILTNARGPWVGFIFGLGIYLLLFNRKLLLPFMGVAILGLGLLTQIPELFERARSIFDTKFDGSNFARINMWTVALDFFKEHPLWGVGYDNIENPFALFLKNQPPEYLQKHVVEHFSYRDHHSSYLNSLNEYGLFFFLLFWGSLFYLLFSSLKKISTPLQKASWVISISFCVVNVFYSEFFSYTGYLFWFFIFLTTHKISGTSSEDHLGWPHDS